MAVFIKRDRLGSGPRPDTFRLREMPKGRSTRFGVMADALQKATEAAAQKREELYESNAEVQNFRRKDETTRGIEAVERMVPTAKAVLEQRTGGEVTHEQARKFAENIAYKGDRQKGGE